MRFNEFITEGKQGLWANIHAKQDRIKHGSGEKMRKPGSKGAPSAQDFKDSANEAANPAQQAAIAVNMKKHHQKPKGVAEGMGGQVVFSGTGANGVEYEIIHHGDDFMIRANGKHIDSYGSLQRAMGVLKNEVPGLTKGVAEGSKYPWLDSPKKKPKPTEPEQGVAEGEYKSRHIHRQEQNKKYDEYRRNQEAAGKKPLSRGDWAATQRKGQQGVAEGTLKEFATYDHNDDGDYDDEGDDELRSLYDTKFELEAELDYADEEDREHLESELEDVHARILELKPDATLEEGENWSKYNHKRVGGMSKKSVSSYRRSHPGSKIQTAVTTKPSKLKKGSKAAKRRASFCARMRGMKKHRTSAKTAHDPNSNINKSLRRWHCESIEELQELVMIAEQFIRNKKNEL